MTEVTDAPLAAPPLDHVRLHGGPPGTLVGDRTLPGLGRITTTVLDPRADLDVLHRWVTAPGTEFWGLAELDREELGDLYAYVDSLPSHHAFLVRRDDEPVALLQTYDPAQDPVGECYPVRPGDTGAHLLVGGRGAPTPGFATRLMATILDLLFTQPGAERIVVEPDVRNVRAIARMRRTGFELGPEIDLPTKRAQLAFLTREVWENP
ncbi:GNAT family N-acetyltransferase [Sanguibacter sp. 25GB23B1]|uniref:GNAT family N-acetyltransferase n=1 Tax=unclassified Sanguibacter TaxID=2645534 RepID=UPI0032AEF5AD